MFCFLICLISVKEKSVVLDPALDLSLMNGVPEQPLKRLQYLLQGTYTVKVTNVFGCESTSSTGVSYSVFSFYIVSVNITNNTATVILSQSGNFEFSLNNFMAGFQYFHQFKYGRIHRLCENKIRMYYRAEELLDFQYTQCNQSQR